MEGTYSVTLEDEVVGSVNVCRSGLYYDLLCRCAVLGEEMLELWLDTAQGIQKIGLIIPAGGKLTLQKRLAMKQAGDGDWRFFLQPRNARKSAFLPVDPHQPFPKLYLIKDCRVVHHNGRIGVEIRQQNIDEKIENKS